MGVEEQVAKLDAAAAEQIDADAAEQHWRAAIELAASSDSTRLVAALALRAGHALLQQERRQTAVLLFEAGLRAIGGDVDDLRSKGFQTDSSLATALSAPADDGAGLMETASDAKLETRLLVGAGDSYLAKVQPAPAIDYLTRAVAKATAGSWPQLRVAALVSLADALRGVGRASESERTLVQAERLVSQHQLRSPRLSLVRAEGAFASAELEMALELFTKAAEGFRDAGDDFRHSRALVGVARCHLALEQLADAHDVALLALEAARSSGSPDWASRFFLGQSLRRMGKLDAAIGHLSAALRQIQLQAAELGTDEGKVSFFDSTADAFDELIVAHVERDAWADVLVAIEEARGQALRDLRLSRGDAPELAIVLARSRQRDRLRGSRAPCRRRRR